MKKITENKRGSNPLISKMILQIAFGLVMMELASAITYMIDGVIIGKYLGDIALAANGIAGPIFTILTIFSGVLASGYQSTGGKQLGKGMVEEARKNWYMTMMTALVISIIATAIGLLFPDEIAALLGAPRTHQELHAKATGYIFGFMTGAVPYIFAAMLVPIVQLNGENSKITISIVAMTIADIAGDLLNVFVFKGGMMGMGIATAFSYYVAALILLSSLLKKNALINIGWCRVDIHTLFENIYQGLPKATKRVCNTIRPAIINRMIIAAAGSAAMVAMSVEINTRYVVESVGVGISGAALLLTGIFVGEMDKNSAERMKKVCFKYICVGVAGLAVLYYFAAPYITAAYVKTDSASYAMAVMVLRAHAVSLPFLAYNEFYLSYFQGLGKVTITHVLNVVQRMVYIIFLSWLFSIFWGIKGIWFAIPATEILMAVTVKLISVFMKEDFGTENLLDEMSVLITEKEHISGLLEKVDEFLYRNHIQEKESYYTHLFFEELSTTIVENGILEHRFGKRRRFLEMRLIRTEDELTIRTRDNCLNISAQEGRKHSNKEDQEKYLGFSMVFSLANDMKYVNSLNINNLIVKLAI